jgi:peptide/nickel transport system substrate-binding protein
MWCLAACSASTAPRAQPGTLVDVESVDGASMNPMYPQTAEDVVYTTILFDGLANLGGDYAAHPALATSWRHSADGLHWDVDLRHGVRWSDGAPFTSKDVVFTYRTMLDPKTASSRLGDIAYLRRVVARGPYGVHFDLAHVSALFVDTVMEIDILPEHVLGRVPPDRQAFTSFGEHPIGTGPYMLARWQHDSDVLFVRNPHYWHGRAKIPRINVRVIFNDQAKADALENGSADLVSDLAYDQAVELRRNAPHVQLMIFPSLYGNVLEFNLRRPGLDDLAVRQAMLYAFDRRAVVDGFFGGQVDVSDGIIPRALTRWYDPAVRRYAYDPARARSLLDAAAWRLGPDGVRRKGNVRLSFEILVNQGSIPILDQVLAFSADMAAVGIEAVPRAIDFPSAVARTYTGDYDMIFDGRGGVVDPDYSDILLSTNRPPAGADTTFYDDPIVDRALIDGLRELDPVKRRAIYNRMQARLAETLPMLVLYGRFAALAYGPRLRLDPAATLQSPLVWYNVQDWQLVR